MCLGGNAAGTSYERSCLPSDFAGKSEVWPSSHQDTLALGRAVGCVRAFILGQSLMDMFAPAGQASTQGKNGLGFGIEGFRASRLGLVQRLGLQGLKT